VARRQALGRQADNLHQYPDLAEPRVASQAAAVLEPEAALAAARAYPAARGPPVAAVAQARAVAALTVVGLLVRLVLQPGV